MPGVKVTTAAGQTDHIKGNLMWSADKNGGLVIQDKQTGNDVAAYPSGRWLRAISDSAEVEEGSDAPMVA